MRSCGARIGAHAARDLEAPCPAAPRARPGGRPDRLSKASCAREQPARQTHLAGAAEAHALHQEVRARQLRHDAHADEEHPELRRLRGDDHVEGQDHGHADADGRAVHRGDQRLRARAAAPPSRRARACRPVRARCPHRDRRRPAASGRCPACRRPRRSRGPRRSSRSRRRPGSALARSSASTCSLRHARRPGVQALGPIQGDQRDARREPRSGCSCSPRTCLLVAADSRVAARRASSARRAGPIQRDSQEPPLRIALAVDGTRGDVHPMLALGVALRERGHQALLCAPPDFAEDADALRPAVPPGRRQRARLPRRARGVRARQRAGDDPRRARLPALEHRAPVPRAGRGGARSRLDLRRGRPALGGLGRRGRRRAATASSPTAPRCCAPPSRRPSSCRATACRAG